VVAAQQPFVDPFARPITANRDDSIQYLVKVWLRLAWGFSAFPLRDSPEPFTRHASTNAVAGVE
jgi:hypothetical protein